MWWEVQGLAFSTHESIKHFREHATRKDERGNFAVQWTELKILSNGRIA